MHATSASLDSVGSYSQCWFLVLVEDQPKRTQWDIRTLLAVFFTLSLPLSYYFPEEKEHYISLGIRLSSLSQKGIIFTTRLHVAELQERTEFSSGLTLLEPWWWARWAGKSRGGVCGVSLCGVTAMAGQLREGTLGATVVLCCGQRALCICEGNSRRERTQKQGMIPDTGGVEIRAVFL